MPRPYLPRLASPPKVTESFRLYRTASRSIAQTIDLQELPPRTAKLITRAVNCYRATKSGSASTTVANTLLALRQLEKRGRAREESLALFASDRAAVDYTTHNIIQPLAKAVLDGLPGSNDALAEAAQNRAAELVLHRRITTSTEPMRLFYGVLRVIFNKSTAHLKEKITKEEAWHRCGRFALAIFAAAGIDHADFESHPDRLTEYLGTDVSIE
jgi:hypothetical protein